MNTMLLKEKIINDLKNAMKRGNQTIVSVLRMALSAIRNKEIEKRIENLGDGEVQEILATEARKRKEAILSFEQGERMDLAKKEKSELVVIKAYLPKEVSIDEIKKVVQETISNTGAEGSKDMGKVMGSVMATLKGRTDGSLVQRVVKEMLT